jgi:hypothetical protein
MEDQFDAAALKTELERKAASRDAAFSLRAARSENELLQMNIDETRRRLTVSESEFSQLTSMMEGSLGGRHAADMVNLAHRDAQEDEIVSLRREMEAQYHQLEEERREAEDWQDRYHEVVAAKERIETDLLETRGEVQRLMAQRPDERTESFQMRRKNRAYAELERVNSELGIDGKPGGEEDWLNNTDPRLTRAMLLAQEGRLGGRQQVAGGAALAGSSESLTGSRGRLGPSITTGRLSVSRGLRTAAAPKSLLAQAIEATSRENYVAKSPRSSRRDATGLSQSFTGLSRPSPQLHGSMMQQSLLSASSQRL